MEVINNKEGKPLEYYLEKFREKEISSMAARCGVTVYGSYDPALCACILLLRFLVDGQYALPSGQYLTYREFPWGEVYLQQFTGRCIKRFAFSYGARPELLCRIMEHLPARRLERSDCGWEVELMPSLGVQLLLWLGDDEFPPNAQILFSDNFRYAFTAEDLANAGDILLGRMKQIGAGI